jgi:hypothetical protein
VFQAIEKYCKVAGGGYSGVQSVSEVPVQMTNNMETFFLVSGSTCRKGSRLTWLQAETLKYLYLLFDDSRTLPLDGKSLVALLDTWLMNTAHRVCI